MKATIADVLQVKGSEVLSTEETETVARAVERMLDAGVGSLLVLAVGRPVGLLTERDVLARVMNMGRAPEATLVREAMTPDPVVVKSSASVRAAMAVMTVYRCRQLPVVEQRRVVGVVSIGDLTKWVTRDLEGQVADMARYIHGQYVSDSMPPGVAESGRAEGNPLRAMISS